MKIQEALNSGDIGNVKTHYDSGFRVHHMYKAEGQEAESSYLSLILADDKSKVLTSEYLSVSEAALIEKSGDKQNFETLFANKEAMVNLAKLYSSSYGFEIKNEALVTAFNNAAGSAADEDKATYKTLRECFGVKEGEKKEEKKEETKEEPKKEETKEGENAEPKEGE